MNMQIEEIKKELVRIKQLLVPRLKKQPNYSVYVYSKSQVEYVETLLNDKGTITLDDQKNIKIGLMAIRENVDKVDSELFGEISKLNWSIGILTGSIDRTKYQS